MLFEEVVMFVDQRMAFSGVVRTRLPSWDRVINAPEEP